MRWPLPLEGLVAGADDVPLDADRARGVDVDADAPAVADIVAGDGHAVDEQGVDALAPDVVDQVAADDDVGGGRAVLEHLGGHAW